MLAERQALTGAEQALRRGDLAGARRLLARYLRADSQNLGAWRLLLSALSEPEHRQRAAREILRLAPGDVAAMQVLRGHNRPDQRSGSRARVPAFGELRHDDDPFGELEQFRARNGLPTPQFPEQQALPLSAQETWSAPSPGNIRRRLPRIKPRLPAFRWPQIAKALANRRPRWRPLAAILGGALLALGIAHFAAPRAGPLLANAFPAIAGQLAHPALAQINYPTESIQEIGLDEPLRNRIAEDGYDLYHFDGVRGLLLSVDVISLEAELDPVVELYDPDGELLRWNDNGDFLLGRGTLDSRLEYVLPLDGTYLISVGSIIGEGKYLISVQYH